MTKPTIITSYSYTDGCEEYFKSFERNVNANLIVVAFDEFKENIHPKKNCKVYKYDKSYPGNTGRLLPILKIIKKDDFDLSGWFIFTDTHDVVFQTDIPDLNNIEESIIACPEDISFKDSDFWRLRVPKSMYEHKVFNVGCFAMRGYQLVDFLEHVQIEWEKIIKMYVNPSDTRFPHDTIVFRDMVASLFNSWADTIVFNKFIRDNKHLVKIHQTLFTCLAHNLDSKRTVIKNGKYLNKESQEYSIVHMNGSTKDLRDEQKI